MEVNVTVSGPTFGALRKPVTVAVRVTASGDLPSHLRQLVEDTVAQTIAGYEAVLDAERRDVATPTGVGSVTAGAEPDDAEAADDLLRQSGAEIIGRDELTHLDGPDIEAIRENVADLREVPTLPDPDVLEVYASRVEVLRSEDGRPMAVVACPFGEHEHRHSLIFAGPGTLPVHPPCGGGVYRVLVAVGMLAGDDVQETVPTRRCGQVGEHDAHEWRDGFGGPFVCEGEVF